MKNSNHLLEKAISIASEAHFGQVDKYGEPYVLHVLRVMARGNNQVEKICGVLHDLVEDTPWTIGGLREAGFPENILEVVNLLTKPEGADYKEYVKKVDLHPVARQIKLNDLQDNMDLKRVTRPLGEKDLERLNRYIWAWGFLTL